MDIKVVGKYKYQSKILYGVSMETLLLTYHHLTLRSDIQAFWLIILEVFEPINIIGNLFVRVHLSKATWWIMKSTDAKQLTVLSSLRASFTASPVPLRLINVISTLSSSTCSSSPTDPTAGCAPGTALNCPYRTCIRAHQSVWETDANN